MNFKSPIFLAGAAVAAVLILSLTLCHKAPSTMEPVAGEQSTIDENIKNYIENNPETIIHSLDKYQERQTNEMMAKLTANIKAKKGELEQNAADPKVGPDAATVKIVEFFDYGCVFCRKMQPIIAKVIQNNPDIQVVFKEMPMFGDTSVSAAKVALAVHKIDPTKYYQFHSNLMRGQNNDNLANAAIDVATALGINADKLKQAMQDPEFDKIIADNRKLANEIGVRGAPALVINGELVIGLMDADMLQSKLDAAKGVKPAIATDKSNEGQAVDNKSADTAAIAPTAAGTAIVTPSAAEADKKAATEKVGDATPAATQ